MPPLTRISSPTWYFRMLASSLALPVGVWEKKAELILRLVTGVVKEGPRREDAGGHPVTETPCPDNKHLLSTLLFAQPYPHHFHNDQGNKKSYGRWP